MNKIEAAVRSGEKYCLLCQNTAPTCVRTELELTYSNLGLPHFRVIAYIEGLSYMSPEYFPDTHFDKAFESLRQRGLAEYPAHVSQQGWGGKDWSFVSSVPMVMKNHYDYLDYVLPEFWPLVFNKTLEEMWCSGIVSAHGDKAYGYKTNWAKAGITFNRGVLLFLLTYQSSILPYDEKIKSCEWVIEHYDEYKDRIEQAEQRAMTKLKAHFFR